MESVNFTYNGGDVREMEERYAVILQQLGHGTYMTRDMQAAASRPVAPVKVAEDIESLREEYKSKFGKKAYHGWSAEELKEKIAGAE